MSDTLPDHSSPDSQGSFLNGFTVGLFAGAAGYFLFSTKKGESFRKLVSSEWDQAKHSLADAGVIDSPAMTVRECIVSVVSTVAKQIDSNKVKSSTKSKTAKAESKADKRRLFKNT